MFLTVVLSHTSVTPKLYMFKDFLTETFKLLVHYAKCLCEVTVDRLTLKLTSLSAPFILECKNSGLRIIIDEIAVSLPLPQ